MRRLAVDRVAMRRLAVDRVAVMTHGAWSHCSIPGGIDWTRTFADIESSWSDEDGNGNEVLIVGASPKDGHAGPRNRSQSERWK
jgi:hypothetical protein